MLFDVEYHVSLTQNLPNNSWLFLSNGGHQKKKLKRSGAQILSFLSPTFISRKVGQIVPRPHVQIPLEFPSVLIEIKI